MKCVIITTQSHQKSSGIEGLSNRKARCIGCIEIPKSYNRMILVVTVLERGSPQEIYTIWRYEIYMFKGKICVPLGEYPSSSQILPHIAPHNHYITHI